MSKIKSNFGRFKSSFMSELTKTEMDHFRSPSDWNRIEMRTHVRGLDKFKKNKSTEWATDSIWSTCNVYKLRVKTCKMFIYTVSIYLITFNWWATKPQEKTSVSVYIAKNRYWKLNLPLKRTLAKCDDVNDDLINKRNDQSRQRQ